MKVLIAGDMHGNIAAMERAFYTAEDYGCSSLVQVGDLGYWEHRPQGVHFMNALECFAEDSGIDMFWADGNHECLPLMYERYKVTANGLRYIRPLIKHVQRGAMVRIGGRKIQFFGGAWSINNPFDEIWKKYPERFGSSATSIGFNWWPEEEPTDEDVQRAKEYIENYGKPDILITHDAPWSLGDSVLPTRDELEDDFPQSKPCRQRIEDVFIAGDPSILIHGHYHHYYKRVMPWGARIVGMAKEESKNALMVLDLDSLSMDMI